MRGKTRRCMKQIERSLLGMEKGDSWRARRALGLRVLEYSELDSSHVEKRLENGSSSRQDMDGLA